jgi:hypothetical protein
MTVSISLFAGIGAQFFTNDGVPLSGGLIYSYEAGTTTPKTTYTSSLGTIAQPNPIILNSAGRVPGGEIWLTLGGYKFILATSTNVTIATYDNVFSVAGDFNLVSNFTGNGTQIIFVLPVAPVHPEYPVVPVIPELPVFPDTPVQPVYPVVPELPVFPV